ncbi:diguanylate cyclase, partial [Ensifer sp. IC4062]|nr:diguanylate cyclase [Ensifer sp. IC4062]
TNIYNRRHFFLTGPRLVEQCLRRGESTAIAVLDIDHFKRLNDREALLAQKTGEIVARRLVGIDEQYCRAPLGQRPVGSGD